MPHLIFETDWGWMGIAGDATSVRNVILPRTDRQLVEEELSVEHMQKGDRDESAAPHLLHRVAKQLDQYLRGRRKEFAVPLDWGGLTAFQRAAYHATQRIPYGEVRSYTWLAKASGSPRAARAAGQCMARNPIPIIVPCHRVIGSSGDLTGFGGGLDLKRRLLALECVRLSGGTQA